MMAASQVRRLPVTQEGKLVGVLSLADLARAGAFWYGGGSGAQRDIQQHLPSTAPQQTGCAQEQG